MTDSNESNTCIDLQDIGLKKFSSLEELEQWCEHERTYWKWLDTPPSKDQETQNTVSHIRAHMRKFYDPINERVRVAKNVHDAPSLAAHYKDIRSMFQGQMLARRVVFSEGPEAKFIDDLRQTNPQPAIYAAAALMDIPGNTQVRGALEGSLLAFAFRHGLSDRTESERASLEALRAEWSGLLADGKAAFEDTARQYNNLVKDGVEQLSTQTKEYKEFKQASEAGFTALITKSEEELKGIERTYDEKLALQSAVQYWKRKADSHSKTATRLSWASVITGVCVALGLVVETHWVIGSEQKVADLLIWKAAMLLLTAVLGVWAVRILVRLLLSNLHLRSDAVERRTMLLTYLALLRRGQGPTEQQRELILQILFRPTTTGIIKDDALPPAVAQWLNLVTSN